MDLERIDQLPGSPAAVLAVLTDRDYLDAYVVGLGATLQAAEVVRDGQVVRTSVTAAIATTGIPGVFKKLVGDSIIVTDQRTYAADGTGCDVHVTAAVSGRKVVVDGTMAFIATGGGTALETRVRITAKVPLVGGQVEQAVRGLLTGRVLASQAEVLTARLIA